MNSFYAFFRDICMPIMAGMFVASLPNPYYWILLSIMLVFAIVEIGAIVHRAYSRYKYAKVTLIP